MGWKKRLSEQDQRITDIGNQVADNIEKLFLLEDKLDNTVPSNDKLKNLEDKIDELANRTLRNNIVMYHIPKGSEGRDCMEFVTNFLSDHMKIRDAEHFEVQRAHRSPTGPTRNCYVRPIHANFLRYKDYHSAEASTPQVKGQSLQRTAYWNIRQRYREC